MNAPSPEAAARPETLHRRLGVWQVSIAGVGVILGAGVYALVAPAAAHAGGALWLSFLIAGVAAGLTGYAYARLGAMRPKASAEFQYTALAFGPTAGFIAGWLMLAADLSATAAVALGFGGYLGHLAGTSITGGALLLVAAAGLVIYAGVGESVGLAIALTVVEAAGLLFVVAAGVPFWSQADYTVMPNGVTGLSAGAALIFFAYLGFDELGNLAEEMRRPERDLPRALFVAMVLSTLIYIGVALSVTALIDWTDLAASPAPLALVARRVLGEGGDRAMTLVALAATANTVLLLLVSASRSIFGMAGAGVLPASLSRLSRTRVPLTATWLALGVTAVLVLGGDLVQVALVTDAAVLVSFMCVNLSLIWLGLRDRKSGRTLRRAADIALPAAGTGLCGWLLLHSGWLGVGGAGVLVLAGILLAPATRAGLRRILGPSVTPPRPGFRV